MTEQGITEAEVAAVLAEPGETVPADGGRQVYQSLTGRTLLRIVVDTRQAPAAVITAYRTSKLRKYWRNK